MNQPDGESARRSESRDSTRSKASQRNRRWDWSNWSLDTQERALILIELIHTVSESRKQVHCRCGREVDWYGLSYLLKQFLFDVGGRLDVEVPFLDSDVKGI